MTSAPKDAALREIACRLRDSAAALQEENERDLAAGREKGLRGAMLDRLALTDARIEAMASGLEQVAALADPVGEIVTQQIRPNGLRIAQIRQPIGVVGIIYESRPNVTADAAALCLKSGNATVLRGGSEAIHSNLALWRVVQAALADAGLPPDAVQLVQTTDRAAVGHLIASPEAVDVIIPRGG